MSKFQTYSVNNKTLFNFYIKYGTLYQYLFSAIYLVTISSTNLLFTESQSKVIAIVGLTFLFVAFIFSIWWKKRGFFKACKENGEVEFLQDAIVLTSNNKREDVDVQQLKHIKLQKVMRGLGTRDIQYHMIRFQSKSNSKNEIITDVYSKGNKNHELLETLDVFSKLNKIPFLK